jgi:hypothetical protein
MILMGRQDVCQPADFYNAIHIFTVVLPQCHERPPVNEILDYVNSSGAEPILPPFISKDRL